MKYISWNVNGLRACIEKGFSDFAIRSDADAIGLQEIKLSEGQLKDFDLPGYHMYWNYAEKKGYSGTALFTKEEPLSVTFGLGIEEHDHEGRMITAEYEDHFFVVCYTPNSKQDLSRLSYRMEWEDAMREYLMRLDQKKPVIYCGDLNVAHEEIDLKNPSSNHHNAGFTDEERDKMSVLLRSGFTDSYRYLHPDETGVYSWWSYRFHARQNNAGWRIDYFIVSERMRDAIKSTDILTDVYGSDHCPVGLDFQL
ncbi:MAG: exodeoxyribonuclease III [Lachnospiraceae bacterium]|nr:exodeoxyribonuclease III [Lachnospiraceae bacterium]